MSAHDPGGHYQKGFRKRRRELLQMLKSGPCQKCGVDYPHYVKDFHHRDGSPVFRISGNKALHRSLESVLSEIAKCDLLCANCHRELTFGPIVAK